MFVIYLWYIVINYVINQNILSMPIFQFNHTINEKYTSLNIHHYIAWFIYEFMDINEEPVPEHEPEPEPARDVFEQDTIIDEEVYKDI